MTDPASSSFPSPPAAGAPLLEIAGLCVTFPSKAGEVRVVDDVSLSILAGECVGIVGESGSGKTMTALASLRLVPAPGQIVAGQVLYQGRDLMTMPEEEVRRMRGVGAALVPQNPMSALNPVLRVGFQIREAMDVHERFSSDEAKLRVPMLMGRMGISGAETRQHDYPHQFSGGMRQRVCIAMALANEPAVVVADEPTTGLDVTIKAQILKELAQLRTDIGAGVIIITHDIDVVARVTDRVIVMYAGQVVESGPTQDVLTRPEHPYTWSLMRSAPSLGTRRGQRLPSIEGMPPSMSDLPVGCRFHPRCPVAVDECRHREPALTAVGVGRDARCLVLMSNALQQPDVITPRQPDATPSGYGSAGDQRENGGPLVQARGLAMDYRIRRAAGGRTRLHAVRGVDLDIWPGETLGLVGESGSGKSTLGRLLVGLERPSSGEVLFGGTDVWRLSARRRRRIQRKVHMIFQDPHSALDPRVRIADSVAEPLTVGGRGSGSASRRAVAELIEACGLRPTDSLRYPHELSGGQLQRASIARALSSGPSFVVADEPVASLDVSIQAQIINLLIEIQQARALTLLFISHDLTVVRNVADRIAVMYLGDIVELGTNDQLYSRPRHPYTSMLLAAAAGRDDQACRVSEIPAAALHSSGCRFRDRCPWAQQICAEQEPPMRQYGDGSWAACHFADSISSRPLSQPSTDKETGVIIK